jgi:hypothetical protein
MTAPSFSTCFLLNSHRVRPVTDGVRHSLEFWGYARA